MARCTPLGWVRGSLAEPRERPLEAARPPGRVNYSPRSGVRPKCGRIANGFPDVIELARKVVGWPARGPGVSHHMWLVARAPDRRPRPAQTSMPRPRAQAQSCPPLTHEPLTVPFQVLHVACQGLVGLECRTARRVLRSTHPVPSLLSRASPKPLPTRSRSTTMPRGGGPGVSHR